MFSMRSLVLRAAAGTAALLAPALVAAEDLTVVSRVSTGKGEPTTATTYMTADKFRTSDPDSDTIIFADGRMIFVNHKKKEYSETSAAEISAFFAQMEAQLAGNPMMEKMMGKIGTVQVTKGAGTRKIAGYDTQQYTLTMAEDLRFELWAAPALGAARQYIAAQKAAYAAMGPMGRRFEKVFEQMEQIQGYPLATSMSSKMMTKTLERTSEATEVKKGPIPASAFEVPAGYAKKDSPFKKK
jgi:hypothetical protein